MTCPVCKVRMTLHVDLWRGAPALGAACLGCGYHSERHVRLVRGQRS